MQSYAEGNLLKVETLFCSFSIEKKHKFWVSWLDQLVIIIITSGYMTLPVLCGAVKVVAYIFAFLLPAGPRQGVVVSSVPPQPLEKKKKFENVRFF